MELAAGDYNLEYNYCIKNIENVSESENRWKVTLILLPFFFKIIEMLNYGNLEDSFLLFHAKTK